jgi:predicted TIM-barrel fold metal-dependent hydrolase
MGNLPKIDIHQHAQKMEYEPDGTPVVNFVTGKPSTADSDESLIARTLEEMDKHNIVKSLISDSFENIYRWVDAAPNRFIPSPMIDGNPPEPSVEAIRDEYRKGRIKGIGEIAAQYCGIPPNDPILEPYWALAEELDAPVFIHLHGAGGFRPTFRSRCGYPLLLEDVLVKHPNIRICIENAGYPFLSDMIALMMMHPTVYADISTHTWIINRDGLYDYLKALLRGGFTSFKAKSEIVHGLPIPKRLMFGSDQMCWPETISMGVDAIESADFLTDEQRRDIFFNNAVRFMSLQFP